MICSAKIKFSIQNDTISTKWYVDNIFGNLYQLSLDSSCADCLINLLNLNNPSILNQISTELSFNLIDFFSI